MGRRQIGLMALVPTPNWRRPVVRSPSGIITKIRRKVPLAINFAKIDIPTTSNTNVRLLFDQMLIRAVKGQIMDTYWRDNSICPKEDAYMVMGYNKTGVAFEFCYELLKLYSGIENGIDLLPVIHLIGMNYQVVDDYVNLKSTKYNEIKGFCDDLTEGKFSLPIIYAVRTHPDDRRLIDILKQHTTDIEVKKQFLDILEEYGSFEYCRKKMLSFCDRIVKELNDLGGHPNLNEIIFLIRGSSQYNDCFDELFFH